MSLNHLLYDIPKPYANIRVNSLKVDNGIIFPGLNPNLPVQTDAKSDLVSLAINLSDNTRVSGVLAIGNGGTNSNSALSNGKLMQSNSGQIVEGTSSSNPSFTTINLTNTTNQLVLGTTNTSTINSSAPSASRVYTIPDSGANSQFVMSDGNQTINGNKTLSGNTTLSSGSLSSSNLLALDSSKIITTTTSALNAEINSVGLGALTSQIQFTNNLPSNITTLQVDLTVPPSGNRTITIPDSGTTSNVSILLSQSNSAQSIDALEVKGNLKMTSLTANKFVVTNGSSILATSDGPSNISYLEMTATNFSIPASTPTAIVFDTTITNNFGGDITITNSGRTFTNTSGGNIYVNISCSYVTTFLDTGNVQLKVFKNGTTDYFYNLISPGATIAPYINTSGSILLANNDFFELVAQLDNAKSVNSRLTIKAF